MARSLARRAERLRADSQKLDLLSPLAVLARGYGVAYREGSKKALRSASSVRIGDRVRVRLHEGEIGTVVRSTAGASAAGPLFADSPSDEQADVGPGLFDPPSGGSKP